MLLVEVQSLSKIFETKEGRIFNRVAKSITAVDGVSFTVSEGEILGLLGPNGAGKTTMIKMLCTLIQPTAGDGFVNGFSVVKKPEKVRENLGVMLTGERTLYWKLTGKENLEYFAALYHMDRKESAKRIEYLLDLVGLKDRADTFVENYSTGMRIRLSFVKALLHNAPVLLLDEPTLGLDPQSSRLIREIILELKKKGHAILLTTHYMEEADQLSDSVAIIDRGKIIAMAAPSALKQSVKSSDIIEIEARNIQPEIVERLKTFTDVLDAVALVNDSAAHSGVIKIHADKGKEVLPSILQALVRRDIGITKVSFVEPTLEDVFIELTGRGLRD